MLQWKDLPAKGYTFDDTTDTVGRQSSFGQLQLCGGRIGYADHEGFLPILSEAVVFGQCLHYIISEDLISGGKQQDMLLQSMGDWVNELLVTEYDWSLDKVSNVPVFFSELSTAYNLWRTTVKPHLPVQLIAVEQEMFMPLGEGKNGNLWLKGTADAVFEDTLMDWKTAGRGWKADKPQLSLQASLYMPLVKQNLNKSIRKFTFWVFNRQWGTWDQFVTQRSIEQINSALKTAYDYTAQIEAKIFPCTPVPESAFQKKRGWYCQPKFCGAWNVCEAKFMNDDVDESKVAVRSW